MKKIKTDIREIRYNLGEICDRLKIILILLSRLAFNYKKRTLKKSYEEYDNFWKNFIESKEIFKTSYSFTFFDKQLNQQLSPLEFRKKVIITILERILIDHHIKTVVEIGSGAGLNLLLVAPRFPDVQFYGIEPTESGVELSKTLLMNPPMEFRIDSNQRPIKNVHILKGSALDLKSISLFEDLDIDLIFTCAVLEQLYNYHEKFFIDLQSLDFNYFLFYEEWLEANTFNNHYLNLVKWDYFRLSWNCFNQYENLTIIDRVYPWTSTILVEIWSCVWRKSEIIEICVV